jgi:hypothetical protein
MNTVPPTAEQLKELVARVVREVLRAGQYQPSKPAQDRSSPSLSSPSTAAARVVAPAEYKNEFAGPVLTAKIADTLIKNESLRVGARTVITPSAADVLRSRGIRVIRGGHAGLRRSSGASVLIADADGLRRCASLSRQLASRHHEGVRGVGLPDLIASVSNASSQGMVIADLPQSCVWLLHREANLCAAQVGVLDDPMEIAQKMQPRVWVLDAKRLTAAALAQLADRCLVATARWPVCPLQGARL